MKHRALRLLACSLIAALTFAACDILDSKSPEDRFGAAFVYLSDYQSAAIGTFDVGDSAVSVSSLSPVHTDVALRSDRGRVFVIERFGKDAIIVLDPESPGAPLANYGVGTGTNPQDIVIESLSRAYVIRLAAPDVLVINPMTGDSLDTIDLSAYADADGLPEMVHAELHDGKLYVLLQLLDINAWYAPTGPGKLAVIDAATGTVDRVVTLTIENPAEFVVDNGTVYVVGGGYGDLSSGGVDRISPGATAMRLTDGSSLNGRPSSVVMAGNRLWTVVSQDWPYGKVYGVNPQSGAVVDSLSGLVSPSSIATDGSVLLVGDTDMEGAGIVAFDALDGTRVQDKVETPLPPRSMVFVKN